MKLQIIEYFIFSSTDEHIICEQLICVQSLVQLWKNRAEKVNGEKSSI